MVLNRVLVTGASGMVGRHVVSGLSDRGISCVASSRTAPAALPEDATWAGFDLANPFDDNDLDRTFGDVDALIHCGAFVPRPGLAVNPRKMIDINVGACHALGNWALSKSASVVFMSGATVYETPEQPSLDETARTGFNTFGGLYGASKLMAEMVFIDLARQGLNVAVLRPTSIYGPGLPDGKMISKFLTAAASGETISLSPPVNDRIGLVYAGDVAEAALRTLEHSAWDIFNVASEETFSIIDIATACVRAIGRGEVNYPADDNRTPVIRFAVDNAKAKKHLGYAPNTSLIDGLRAMSTDMTANQPSAGNTCYS